MAFLISVLACVLFGVMPLRQIFQADPNDAIKGAGSQSGAGRRWALRDLLLAAQIALCCVTVTAAFVSMRGMLKSLTVDKGFNPSNAVLTKFDLSQADYSGDGGGTGSAPATGKGVAATGSGSSRLRQYHAPLGYGRTSLSLLNKRPTSKTPTKHLILFSSTSLPGISAAQTPLLAGRDFSFSDKANTPPVAIVNQQFARHLFHSDQAVGRYFKDSSGKSIQIVGMVPDGKYFLLSEEPQEAAYFPILQRPNTTTHLIVRNAA